MYISIHVMWVLNTIITLLLCGNMAQSLGKILETPKPIFTAVFTDETVTDRDTL